MTMDTKIKKLHAEGYTNSEMAQILNIDIKIIQAQLVKWGWNRRTKKLTPTDRRILELHKLGIYT